MRKFTLSFLTVICGIAINASAAEPAKPLRALYVTGGCCHDYKQQKVIIPEGVSKIANVEWTVVHEGGSGTKNKDLEKSVFQNPDWAKGYDVVVHNECFADDTDTNYIQKVLAPHRAGVPAVVVHCAMHTFRAWKQDTWREFLGVSSFGHGPAHPLTINVVKADHPIMKGFQDGWVTPDNEELYAISKFWTNSVALAQSTEKDGKKHTVFWVNTFGQGRVFGISLPHSNKTTSAPMFLGVMTRGLLWACDKLDDSGLPKPGYEARSK